MPRQTKKTLPKRSSMHTRNCNCSHCRSNIFSFTSNETRRSSRTPNRDVTEPRSHLNDPNQQSRTSDASTSRGRQIPPNPTLPVVSSKQSRRPSRSKTQIHAVAVQTVTESSSSRKQLLTTPSNLIQPTTSFQSKRSVVKSQLQIPTSEKQSQMSLSQRKQPVINRVLPTTSFQSKRPLVKSQPQISTIETQLQSATSEINPTTSFQPKRSLAKSTSYERRPNIQTHSQSTEPISTSRLTKEKNKSFSKQSRRSSLRLAASDPYRRPSQIKDPNPQMTTDTSAGSTMKQSSNPRKQKFLSPSVETQSKCSLLNDPNPQTSDRSSPVTSIQTRHSSNRSAISRPYRSRTNVPTILIPENILSNLPPKQPFYVYADPNAAATSTSESQDSIYLLTDSKSLMQPSDSMYLWATPDMLAESSATENPVYLVADPTPVTRPPQQDSSTVNLQKQSTHDDNCSCTSCLMNILAEDVARNIRPQFDVVRPPRGLENMAAQITIKSTEPLHAPNCSCTECTHKQLLVKILGKEMARSVKKKDLKMEVASKRRKTKPHKIDCRCEHCQRTRGNLPLLAEAVFSYTTDCKAPTIPISPCLSFSDTCYCINCRIATGEIRLIVSTPRLIQQFLCSFCKEGYTFDRRRAAEENMELNRSNNQGTCITCGNEIPPPRPTQGLSPHRPNCSCERCTGNWAALLQAIDEVTPLDNLICENCGETFPCNKEDELNQHKITHLESSRMSPQPSTSKAHDYNKKPVSRMPPQPSTSTGQDNYSRRIFVSSAREVHNRLCRDCSQLFVYNRSELQQVNNRTYCILCRRIYIRSSTPSPQPSTSQMSEATETDNIICSKCAKIFQGNRRGELNKHFVTYHKINPKTIRCLYCYGTFHLRSNMVRHIREIHWGVPRFKCNKCMFATPQKDKLIQHKNRDHSSDEEDSESEDDSK